MSAESGAKVETAKVTLLRFGKISWNEFSFLLTNLIEGSLTEIVSGNTVGDSLADVEADATLFSLFGYGLNACDAAALGRDSTVTLCIEINAWSFVDNLHGARNFGSQICVDIFGHFFSV